MNKALIYKIAKKGWNILVSLVLIYLFLPVMGCATSLRNSEIIINHEFSYDASTSEKMPTQGNIELHGASVVRNKDKNNDGILRMKDSQYAELKNVSGIKGGSGTINLWIKPIWEPNDGKSHIIFSMTWDDEKKGYMALSWGWWEPLGSSRLYFIMNNQESIGCSTDQKLDFNDWSMVTMTWSNGERPGCKLFVDGQKLAERKLNFQGNYDSKMPLYIGSDIGSTESKGRTSDFDLDSILILANDLSEKDVFTLYKESVNKYNDLVERKDDWLNQFTGKSNAPVLSNQGGVVQNRVIFDESADWAMSDLEIDRLLSRIKKAGFNVLVPCVWHGGGSHYPSPIAEMDPAVKAASKRGRDPLAVLINKAHKMGIEIHPWFTVVRREGDKLPQFYGKGVPEAAYDVHNENFRIYIVNLMADMIQRYPVDGINLDYIRAMGICESENCRQDYARRTGHDLMADYNLAGVGGSAAHNRIRLWQEQAVTDIVKRLSKIVRSTKPEIVISVDGNPEIDEDKLGLEGRNELAWVNEGIVDVVFDMDYRLKPDIKKIESIRSKMGKKGILIPIFGNYDLRDDQVIPRSGRIVSNYAQYASEYWGSNGVAYYQIQWLTDEQIKSLMARPFAEPAITAWALKMNNTH